MQNYHTMVVGAGAVGLSCALALARQGQSVALIAPDAPNGQDNHLPSQKDARVFALSNQSIAFLQSIGVWQYVLDTKRLVVYDKMQVWQQDGHGRLDFYENTGLGAMVEPCVLLYALRQALTTYMVTGQVSCYRTQVAQVLDIENPRVALSTGASIKAHIGIVADGARSSVRDMLGIGVRVLDYQQVALCATICTDIPHDNTARQIMLPTGTLAWLPIFDNKAHWHSIVWSLPKLLAHDIKQDFASHLMQKSRGFLPNIHALQSLGEYPLQAHLARQMVKGNWLLMGDCAHGIHPLAGQGLNLGLGDVMAWAKLQHLPMPHAIARYARQMPKNAITMHAMSAINFAYAGLGTNNAPWIGMRDMAFSMACKSTWIKKILQKQAGV